MSSIFFASAMLSYLMGGARCQGVALLTLSTNPVYKGELVKITCSYGAGEMLVRASMYAKKGTHLQGSLDCIVPVKKTTSSGVLNGTTFDGCPTSEEGSTNFSLSLLADESLELDFSCKARLVDDHGHVTFLNSSATSLAVHVYPDFPKIFPHAVTFNSSENAIISCESRNGIPAANIWLTVTDILNRRRTSISGVELASLKLPSPLADWHNAMATCSVSNHKRLNAITDSRVMINHIRKTNTPDILFTGESNVVLNCSTFVSSYPGVMYSWTTPQNATVREGLHLWDLSLEVLQGQSGLFNCTATNNVTLSSVVVVFHLSKAIRGSGCKQCWTIGVAFGIIVIIVILFLLHKRGHFAKLRSTSRSEYQQPEKYAAEEIIIINSSQPSADRVYDSLDLQKINEQTYAQLLI